MTRNNVTPKQKHGKKLSHAEADRLARTRQSIEMRKAQEAKEARAHNITIAVVLIAALVTVCVVVGMLWNDSKKSATPSNIKLPAYIADSHGVTISGNGINKPQDGKPKIDLYYDYTCIHCNELEDSIGDQLLKAADEGKINLTLKPVITTSAGAPYGIYAAGAAMQIAAEQPDKFQAFHVAAFKKFEEAANGNQQILIDDKQAQDTVTQVAKSVGISDELIKKFDAGFARTTMENWTKKWGDSGIVAKDQYGTPMLVRDGKKVDGKTFPEVLQNALK
ncbi:MAG: thioredoxin domain-containing protein [Actinomycetaceae bacterium]|nr:thioredoxin domain-containing protein [Actinomycetaceae bacterium]